MPPFPAPAPQFVNEAVGDFEYEPCTQVTFYMKLSLKDLLWDLTREHGPSYLLDNSLENESKIQIAASETFSSGLS